MTGPGLSQRFGTIFLSLDSGIAFECDDARVEVTRAINSVGRRSGSSLDIRVHVVVDLNTLRGSNITPQLFQSSIQPDDILIGFKIDWNNPVSGAIGGIGPLARQMAFSGWISGFEIYRPEKTGSDSFGGGEASVGTRLGIADSLLHLTIAVVTDDENFANITLTE
jgi:hypothetical protein